MDRPLGSTETSAQEVRKCRALGMMTDEGLSTTHSVIEEKE